MNKNNFIQNYISSEQFEIYCQMGTMYEGFVIGMGYAWTSFRSVFLQDLIPTPKFTTRTETAKTYKIQYLDTSDKCIALSLKGCKENDPPLKLKKLPTMCHQETGFATCAILTFDFISRYYQGDKMGIHRSDFIASLEFRNIKEMANHFFYNGFEIMPLGIDFNQTKKILDTFFDYDPLDDSENIILSIIGSLERNHPIFVTYGGQGVKDRHAVVIVGYDKDTEHIIIADSLAKGGEKNMRFDREMFQNYFEIKGLKSESELEKYTNNEDWWLQCDTIDVKM